MARKPKPPKGPTLAGPPSIPVGTSIQVTGAGFAPGSVVTLDDGHMNPANNDIPIGPDGSFTHGMGYVYTGANEGGSRNAVRALVDGQEVAIHYFTVEPVVEFGTEQETEVVVEEAGLPDCCGVPGSPTCCMPAEVE